MITRRGILAAATAPFAGWAQSKPNVLLILADDLGLGDLSCYGQKEFQTPHIDQLAAEGARFTQAYAGNPVCAPSRCTLMTGKHNGHGRVRGNHTHDGRRSGLKAGDSTVAETMRQAGYRTGLIGKWGLGEAETEGIPTRKGFDFFYGFLNQDHASDHYPDFLWRNTEKEQLQKKHYAQDLFTAEALKFLQPGGDKPWFLELAYTLPHEDFTVPDADRAPFTNRFGGGEAATLAAMIAKLDRDVGKVLAHLRATRQLENTLVIFTSDNGAPKAHQRFQGNGIFRGLKGSVYEGGLRVPYIVRGRGIAAKAVQSTPVGFVDFYPTMCAVAGVAPPAGLDGIALLDVWRGGAAPERSTPLYWELNSKGVGLQAMRQGDWKLVRNGVDSPPELYNLARDPGEHHDLAAAETDRVQRMVAALNAQHVDSTEYLLTGGKKKK